MSLEAMSGMPEQPRNHHEGREDREEEQTHSLTLRALRDFAIFVTLS